jgi:hypothetical protein
MKFTYMYLLPMAPEDFLRGPNWRAVDFLTGPVRWVLGLILALVVIAAIIRAAILLFGLAGADRHKARNIGEGFLFCIVAVLISLMFAPLFGSMIDGMS